LPAALKRLEAERCAFAGYWKILLIDLWQEGRSRENFLKYIGIIASAVWSVIQILTTPYLNEAQKYFAFNMMLSLGISGYILLILEKKKVYYSDEL
jgi:hypothetical protein